MTFPALTLASPVEQAPLDHLPFARWRSEAGAVTVEFHRVQAGYLVRFVGRADFLISANGARVQAVPVPGLAAEAVSDLYDNQVVPMIRGQRGELALHASAVSLDGRAIAFIGGTGRGKSTLAAAFAQMAHPFLSDDGLYLKPDAGCYWVQPNNPSFRLCADSHAWFAPGRPPGNGHKSRLPADEALPFADAALPLAGVFILGRDTGTQVRIEPLRGGRAVAELLNHSFLLDVEDRARMTEHLSQLAALVETIPCYTLDHPRDFAQLPRVVAEVRAQVGERLATA